MGGELALATAVLSRCRAPPRPSPKMAFLLVTLNPLAFFMDARCIRYLSPSQDGKLASIKRLN